MANEISMGHARALLGLEPAMQIALAQEIASKGLSVRQVETMVSRIEQVKDKKTNVQPKVKDSDTLRLEEDLSNAIGASVKLTANRKGKGKLVIEFSSYDQLDGIISYFGDFS